MSRLASQGGTTLGVSFIVSLAISLWTANPNFAHVLTEASEKTLYSPLWRSCNLPDFH
jgi:hypothetical protein